MSTYPKPTTGEAIHKRLEYELVVSAMLNGIFSEITGMLQENRTGSEFAMAYVNRHGRKDPSRAVSTFSLDADTINAALRYWADCIRAEAQGRMNVPTDKAAKPADAKPGT